jgi:hypothetical protein
MTVAVPSTVPAVAVIVALPTSTAVTRPCDPAAFETVATLVLDDDHVTWVVMSFVELSL